MTQGALTAYPPTRTGVFATPIDHFRFALPVKTFGLRFALFDKFAASKAAPVLFYCGNEGALELFYDASGALFEHAQALRATVFFVEHRYYGNSLPLGTNGSFTNDGLQFLSIEQALADYALLISELPRLIGCSGTGARAAASRCDVILFGGSYGGMLAAWHRIRFPHLSVGAIASGAPVDFYPGEAVQTAFSAAVEHTFTTYGGRPGCGRALRTALAAADAATNSALQAAGIVPCAPLEQDSAERYAMYARGAIASIAMVDYPYATDFIAPLPANPVHAACDALTGSARGGSGGDTSGGGSDTSGGSGSGGSGSGGSGGSGSGGSGSGSGSGSSDATTLLSRLHAAVLGLVNASNDLRCVDLRSELVGGVVGGNGGGAASGERPARALSPTARRPGLRGTSLGVVAWNYQACTELILEPLTSNGYGFYPQASSQVNEMEKLCAARYSVQPRAKWMGVAYGLGADFRHASNLVFMENEKDPWHVGTSSIAARGGVNGTVTRTLAKGGAHHQDLRSSSPLDAPEVKAARAFERAEMHAWLRA